MQECKLEYADPFYRKSWNKSRSIQQNKAENTDPFCKFTEVSNIK